MSTDVKILKMNSTLSHVYLETDTKRTLLIEDVKIFSHTLHKSEFETICNNVNIVPYNIEINKLRKYFIIWKHYVHTKKLKLENSDKELQQREKLEGFIKSLKKVQQKPLHSDGKYRQKPIKESQILHRFHAQKEIIELQKKKLHQQRNVINQLKLGILEEAVDESIVQAKKNVAEVLQNCSVTVKCKIKSNVFLESINRDLLELGVKSDKVPKLIKEIEKRAVYREQRRQDISERKKLMDASKKLALENDIMEKRRLSDEERKVCMEELQKRREAQLKYYRQAKLNREKELQDNAKAVSCYEKNLKKGTFDIFHRLIRIKYNNFIKSKVHHEMRLKRKSFKQWKQFLAEIEYRRNYNVLQFYNSKMKKKMFFVWFKMYILSIQHSQVARDFYTMKLEHKSFNHWHRYVCTQQFVEMNNTQKALRHYEKWILLHYFYQWKSLPAVIAIERAKEQKKRKWREKVWEVVPDYKPVNEDHF